MIELAVAYFATFIVVAAILFKAQGLNGIDLRNWWATTRSLATLWVTMYVTLFLIHRVYVLWESLI